MSRELLLSFAFGLSALAVVLVCSTALPAQELDKNQEDLTVVRTAEELIKRIDSNKPQRLGFTKQKLVDLSEAEVAKAVQTLRARFPFQSVRERMAFQGEHEIELPEILKSSKSKPRSRNPFMYGRTGALEALHSEEVSSFIQREGQGFARMPLPTPYWLRPYSNYATRIETREIDSVLKAEPIVELDSVKDSKAGDVWVYGKTGLPRNELMQYFHSTTTSGFASMQNIGLVRNIDEVAGFEAHRVRLSSDPQGFTNANGLPNYFAASKNRSDEAGLKLTKRLQPQKGIHWRTNRLQLVSLLMHDQPKVYVSENLPNMEELASEDIETRGLSPFESNALQKLKKGEDVVTQATLNRILMVGAVRANVSCLSCHSGKDKDLLGAFSYEFIREPRLKDPQTKKRPAF